MDKKNKIIVLLFITICGLSASAYLLYESSSNRAVYGNYNILLLCINPSETIQGMGAVDMAYVISMNNGKITNLTSIYPDKITHPNATVSKYLQSIGKTKISLQECFWENDTENNAKLAQEIVECRKDIKIDVVLAVTPTAFYTVMDAIGPVSVPGVGPITGSTSDWLLDDQNNVTTRNLEVKSIMSTISNTTPDQTKFTTLMKIISNQYNHGNIYVYPKSFYNRLLVAENSANIFAILW